MRFDRDANRLTMSVTELARYAYQRENPRALADRYGFRRLTDGEGPEPPDADFAPGLPHAYIVSTKGVVQASA